MNAKKNTDVTPGPKPTPTLEIATTPGFPTALRVRYAGYTAGRYDLWWGDHKGKSSGPTGSSYATHLYSRPGVYNVAAFKAGLTGNADFLQQRTVAVRGSAAPLGIEFGPADDPDVAEARFIDTEDGTGLLPHFRVEWPDGTVDEAHAVPGQKVQRYLGQGDHTITVYDTTSGLEGTFHLKLDGVHYDPNFTVEKAPEQDEHQRAARLKFTTVTETTPVLIYWGDERGGDPQRIEAPKVGQAVDHTYDRDGSYPVLVVYEDGSTQPELGLSLNVTVPWGSRD